MVAGDSIAAEELAGVSIERRYLKKAPISWPPLKTAPSLLTPRATARLALARRYQRPGDWWSFFPDSADS